MEISIVNQQFIEGQIALHQKNLASYQNNLNDAKSAEMRKFFEQQIAEINTEISNLQERKCSYLVVLLM